MASDMRVVAQQPVWDPPQSAARVLRDLAGRPPLVEPDACLALTAELTMAARGEAFVIQGGDCAEPFVDSAPHRVRAKASQLHRLGDTIERITGLPAVRIGRLAGQYAKPRSSPVEQIPGVGVLPVYRGDAVNSPERTAQARRADPRRLARAYDAAATALSALLPREMLFLPAGTGTVAPIYTSHEALLLDYERALLRRQGGIPYSSSAHMLWIGDRTRQLNGPHMAFVRLITNAVGVKIGPAARPEEVAALVEWLVPDRPPGGLVLILRLGVDRIADLLPDVVTAVGRYADRVLWMCDPMHGNTRRLADGRKTRVLTDLMREVELFATILSARGIWPGGLHLEITPDPIAECVPNDAAATRAASAGPFLSACDPRLNPAQAESVVRHAAGLIGSRPAKSC